MMILRTGIPCVTALILAAASLAAANPLRLPDTQLIPAAFDALNSWNEDDHARAFGAFRDSCQAILHRERAKVEVKPLEKALRGACAHAALYADPVSDQTARAFFEIHFLPVRISRVGETEVFITGYYEPEIEGNLEPGNGFTVPFYRRPPELRTRSPGAAKTKGPTRAAAAKRSKSGVRQGGRFVPFHDRAAIEDGALKGRELELVWTNDEIDAFFTHIQGSARVRLPDGSLMRINYDAQNGHPYLAVGRILIERGIVPKEEMTMDKIRTYISEHPEDGRELMRMNRSYVFFREVKGLESADEPAGAQGVSLTVNRSIAVDRALHVYGTPFWIEATLPIEHESAETPFRRLMVAQDTGGAIVGPARADIYFGAGVEAGAVAGRLRHPGTFYMLVPRTMDPKRLAPAPTPPARPKDGKQDTKSASRK
jgi:membrane-bound lytic murein transglycosylase A